MTELALLVALGGCYAAIRLARLANWYTVAGAYRMFAMWLVLVLIGYGTPLYVLPALLAAAVLWSGLRRRQVLQVVLELAVFCLLVMSSGMPLKAEYLVLALSFDQVLTRLALLRYDPQRIPRKRVHRLLVSGGSLAGVVVLVYLCLPDAQRYLERHDPAELLRLAPKGLPAPWLRQRTLPEGVYWEGRFPLHAQRCALVFHGAAPAGSLQSTGLSLTQSLLQQRTRIFAVDHPGFGASPAPSATAPVEAWDPAPLTAAVLERMRLAGCRNQWLIGHSQGVTEALRLLRMENDSFLGVAVLGAGLYEDTEGSKQYWYNRFHIDRRITGRVPYERWLAIRDRYYRNEAYCATADFEPQTGGATLAYVVFRDEHDDLKRTREQLWECLRYPDGRRLAFDSGHYLNSGQFGPFTLISLPHVRAFGSEVLRTMP